MFENLMLYEKPIKVLTASGYNDGYYWDMNATVEYDGAVYNIINAGSGSGYILNMAAVIKGDFERLFGEEQEEIKFEEWEESYIERAISDLLGKFFESGAKEKWECREDDDWNFHTIIDGEEIVSEESED